MPLKTNSALPKEVQQAAKQVADDITYATICNLFGTPELAHQEFQNNPPTTGFFMRAAEWVEKYLASSDNAIEKEQASMAGMPKGQSVPTVEGPNDKLTFPGKAPAPSYTMPGDKTKTPGTATPTQKLNDDTVQPDGSRPETYSPPGDKTGTPGTATPTEKENDESLFPKQTSAGKDLSQKVPPSQQPPETERHNPDLHQEKEKAGVPAPPWEVAFTPGMDFMTKSEGAPMAEEKPPAEEDDHCARVEKCAREVDLYHRRYAKRNNMKDLEKQAGSFKAERDVMDEQKECCKCEDDQKKKAKEMFAFSYGQMRRSLRQAMRQFTEAEEVEDVEAYHQIHSMRADLLGEKSQRHFANACLSMQYARFAAFEEEEVKKEEECSEEFADEFGECKAGEPAAAPTHEEDDMKETDVKAGLDFAMKMQAAGIIGADKVSDMAFKVAKMDPSARATFVEMANEMMGECKPEEEEKEVPPSAGCKSASAAVAEKNMVRTASRQLAGGKAQQQNAGGFMGLFMGGNQAPIFGGK